MARSLSITGRYDENVADLREQAAGAKGKPLTDQSRARSIGLAALESLADVAKPGDAVHVSINSGEDGSGGRTYTVTVTHTPGK